MRNVRNITVAVTPELYRQTRMLAVEYDTTVTALVAYLLERMPKALKAARFPVGGPRPTPSAPTTQSAGQPPETAADISTPSSEEIAISSCTPVNHP